MAQIVYSTATDTQQDFGTSYSGVAYAFSTKPEDIYIISEWPGAKGKTSPKCPTLIKYGPDSNFAWGFQVDRTSDDLIDSFKLLLDPDQPKPLYLPPGHTEAKLAKLGKPAMAVTTDYIKAILQHALTTIDAKYPPNYLKMLKKRYVLSVPAVWSDKAKDATLQAARNAGVASIKLIKEPEAAALFTLHHLGNKGLSPGDALVICDAGGGTVDLISYEILKLEPLELKELTTCSGGVAGSLMLNRRFEDWIKSIVGENSYLTLRETDAYRRAMISFDDVIKPGFHSRDDKHEYITFPTAKLKDKPAQGLVSDTLTVTGETLYQLFDPIFRDIDKLITEQVNSVMLKRLKERNPGGEDVKAIFLVGGFGSSEYLRKATEEAHPEIRVIRPNDAWSAIVRGAVMSRLPSEAKVTINHAPKHYGVSARRVVKNDEDDVGQKRKWDDVTGDWRVSKMTWYINKGEDLHRARRIEWSFSRNFASRPKAGDLHFTAILMECSSEKAPLYPTPGNWTFFRSVALEILLLTLTPCCRLNSQQC